MLRNLVDSQDDLETASERLGHASSSTTTQKHYRSNTSRVTPLSRKLIAENSPESGETYCKI
jgi:hypothetical protein